MHKNAESKVIYLFLWSFSRWERLTVTAWRPSLDLSLCIWSV